MVCVFWYRDVNYCASGATTWNDIVLMANEERVSTSPRTCRLTATGDAQTLILSSFAIRIVNFNLRDMPSGNIFDADPVVHVLEINTPNINIGIAVKVH